MTTPHEIEVDDEVYAALRALGSPEDSDADLLRKVLVSFRETPEGRELFFGHYTTSE